MPPKPKPGSRKSSALNLAIAQSLIGTRLVTKRSDLSDPLPDWDTVLLNCPGIGGLYEAYRKETYFRYDTQVMYFTLVGEVVKNYVQELTAEKGVKLLRSYDCNPFLTEMYKVTASDQQAPPTPPPRAT